MQRHIPCEACLLLSKLEAGRATIFSGFPFARPKRPLPTTRPRPRIMNSLHPLVPSFICNLRSTRSLLWLLARSWGKASDAYMPFVPVSMEATTSAIYFPTLFSDRPSSSYFLISFVSVQSIFYSWLAGINCAPAEHTNTISYIASSSQKYQFSTSIKPPRLTCHPRRAQPTFGDLLLRAKAPAVKTASSSSNGVQRPRPRTCSQRHSCHRRRCDPRRC